MVAVVGPPNAGKSSLINNFLGHDLSIVTHKAQTTRNAFHCVTTIDRTEIIFIDTPGLHRSQKEINIRMNHQALEGRSGADICLFLLPVHHSLKTALEQFAQNQHLPHEPTWLVLTKTDTLSEADVLKKREEEFNEIKKEYPLLEKIFFVSNTTEENYHLLTGALCDQAPQGPHLYQGARISNKNVRFFVTEYIREQLFLCLNEELPYEVAVVIREYEDLRKKGAEEQENKDLAAKIQADIIVARTSQRSIVIGRQGAQVRNIIQKSKIKIEKLIDGKVELRLHVKVIPHWQKKHYVLKDIGLERAPESHRVWRKRR